MEAAHEEATILHHAVEELDLVTTEARPEAKFLVEPDTTPSAETEDGPELATTFDDTKDDEFSIEVEPPEQRERTISAVNKLQLFGRKKRELRTRCGAAPNASVQEKGGKQCRRIM